MRILYWVGHIGNKFGAYEKYILLFAKVCRARGHKLTVLHEGFNSVRFYRNTLCELGAEYVSIPHTLKEPMQGIPSAINVIKKHRPDIIHFNFTNPLIMPLAKLFGIPLGYRTCHNGIPKITVKTRISKTMNNIFIDRFFAVSRHVRDDEICAGVRKDKLFLNFLGLPIESYAEGNLSIFDEPLPSASNDTQRRKIITVGRFFPEKGMRFVTEVAVETMHRFPDVVWWMVGGVGPDSAFCEDMVIRNHLENRIIFLGQRNDVPALMEHSYIQVVGSLFEGLPLNVLESSLLGIPTIGPNTQGLDEAIQNDQTGLLVESRSIESFISAIGKLLENPDLRNRLGTNAKNFVIENHDSSYWIEKLMEYYELDYHEKVDRSPAFMVTEKSKHKSVPEGAPKRIYPRK
ncbi:MAG TPA: glycosyltransferase [Anaerolineales bacterium]|nr:glycosyltransferase [Anaerolineales bacterium]HLO31252.1 glycosyltransferase [Anaerolineales bacterium]